MEEVALVPDNIHFAHFRARVKDTPQRAVVVEADIEAYHPAFGVLATSLSAYGLDSWVEEMPERKSLSGSVQEEGESRICSRMQPLVHCSTHVLRDIDLDAVDPIDPADSLPSFCPRSQASINRNCWLQCVLLLRHHTSVTIVVTPPPK